MASTVRPERPGPLPEPPDDLATRELPLAEAPGPWTRLHWLSKDPIFFGKTDGNRFDAPNEEYGVLYAGQDAHCAFIETHGDALSRVVSTTELARKGFALILPSQPLRLVDLTGPGLARLCADERLASGNHAGARRWALALWAHPSSPDGLLYRARHDPSRRSVAIFDRAEGHLDVRHLGGLLDPLNARLVADILDTYGFGLVGPYP